MKNMMKCFLSTLLVLAIMGKVMAQGYKPADQGSTVSFVIKNFGFNSSGSFSGLDGTIMWDGNSPAQSSFDVSVAAASVNTDNNLRDKHLREDSYFDVEKYPRIRIVSGGIVGPDKSGHYTFNGKLTIKGTTKDISFPFIVTPMGDDLIFKGEFTINRRDFGVGGSSSLSNSLTVSLTVLAKKE